MKTIAVDFDDTICKTAEHILDLVGLFFNETYDMSQLNEYDISECLNIPKEIELDAVDLAVSNEDLPLEKGADEVIRWLSQFYNIHIVTSRKPEYLEYVEDIIYNNNLAQYITDIHSSDTKAELVSYMNAVALIEDNPKYILKYMNDIDILIFDKPWNKHIRNTYNKFRVKNWNEIKDFFMIKLGSKN